MDSGWNLKKTKMVLRNFVKVKPGIKTVARNGLLAITAPSNGNRPSTLEVIFPI